METEIKEKKKRKKNHNNSSAFTWESLHTTYTSIIPSQLKTVILNKYCMYYVPGFVSHAILSLSHKD